MCLPTLYVEDCSVRAFVAQGKEGQGGDSILPSFLTTVLANKKKEKKRNKKKPINCHQWGQRTQ
jgi:hypothetical protein